MNSWENWTVEQLNEILADLVPPSELKGLRKSALVALARTHLGDEPPSKEAAASAVADAAEADTPLMSQEEAAAAVRASMPVVAGTDAAEAVKAWREAPVEPLPEAVLPELSQWEMMEHMAARMARSALMPPHLRHKPDDILIVLLHAHDYHLSTSMAISEIIVIDGKPTKSAFLLGYLIERDGHKIWPVVDYDAKGRPVAATMYGIRKDDPDRIRDARYTIQDAAKAGLCEINEHGDVIARSRNDNPLAWEKFTEDMLVARATSRLARRAFRSAVGGAAYTPDELGFIEGEGTEVAPTGPAATDVPMDEVQISQFRERLAKLTPELAAEVRSVWKARQFPPLDKLSANHYGPIDAIIAAREKQMPEDAETIEPDLTPCEEADGVDGSQQPSLADTDPAPGPEVVDLIPCEDCNQIGTHADDCPQRPM